MSVAFSELYKLSSNIVAWSPDGKFIATGFQQRVIIRDLESMQIVRLFNNIDAIDQIEWSPNGRYVLCAMFKRATVQAYCVDDPDWRCKLSEGLAGLSSAKWTADSQHIMTVTEFNLHLTIWNLKDGSVRHINNPKAPLQAAISFNSSGKFMVVAVRRECKDLALIINTASWEIIKEFPIKSTDLVSIDWSPKDDLIVVRDNQLEYRMLFYTPTGKLVSEYQAYEDFLGVKSSSISPSGEFLAIGSFDSYIRLISTLTCKRFAEFEHTSDIALNEKLESVSLFMERSDPGRYELVDDSFKMRYVAAVPGKNSAIPRMGIGMVSWSLDEKFVASRSDEYPNAVFIWDVAKLELHTILEHQSPVRGFRWSEKSCTLAICSGESKMFIWSPRAARIIPIPTENFPVKGIRWNPAQECVTLISSGRFCCCDVQSL